MDERMEGKHVGDTDAIEGVLDGTPYKLFVMKDVLFNTKIMSTYGSLIEHPEAKEQRRTVENEQRTFRYTEPFHNHYLYRHAVDDHNNHRHSDISLEETWVTHDWENRVFSFLLAITEVNMFLLCRYFKLECGKDITLLDFRRKLAKSLIDNEHLFAESPRHGIRKRGRITDHELQRAPNHARCFLAGNWICTASFQYQKYTCKTSGCKRLVRTYCSCTPGHWMCTQCFGDHKVNVEQ